MLSATFSNVSLQNTTNNRCNAKVASITLIKMVFDVHGFPAMINDIRLRNCPIVRQCYGHVCNLLPINTRLFKFLSNSNISYYPHRLIAVVWVGRSVSSPFVCVSISIKGKRLELSASQHQSRHG